MRALSVSIYIIVRFNPFFIPIPKAITVFKFVRKYNNKEYAVAVGNG